jgi:hypothetical protein
LRACARGRTRAARRRSGRRRHDRPVRVAVARAAWALVAAGGGKIVWVAAARVAAARAVAARAAVALVAARAAVRAGAEWATALGAQLRSQVDGAPRSGGGRWWRRREGASGGGAVREPCARKHLARHVISKWCSASVLFQR